MDLTYLFCFTNVFFRLIRAVNIRSEASFLILKTFNLAHTSDATCKQNTFYLPFDLTTSAVV